MRPIKKFADINNRNDVPEDVKQFIAENIAIEKSMQEIMQKFNGFTQIIPHPMFEIGLNGNFTFINRDVLNTFEYTYNDFKSADINFFQLFSSEDTTRINYKIKEILSGGKNDDQEYEALKSNGKKFPVSIRFNIITRDENVIGLRGVILDKTEIKKIRKKAQNLELQQKKFNETFSHNLRTTLTNVKGFIEVMQTREKLTPLQYEKCFDYINKNIERLINLANEFSV